MTNTPPTTKTTSSPFAVVLRLSIASIALTLFLFQFGPYVQADAFALVGLTPDAKEFTPFLARFSIVACIFLIFFYGLYLTNTASISKNKKIATSSALLCLLTFLLLNTFNYISFYKEKTAATFEVVTACTRDHHKCIDNALLVSSIIQTGLNKEIEHQLNQRPEIDTLCFNSPGGEVHEAQAIIKTIQTRKLSTCIADSYFRSNGTVADYYKYPSLCGSSCTLVTMAGKRVIGLGDSNSIRIHGSGTYTDVGFAKLLRPVDRLTDIIEIYANSTTITKKKQLLKRMLEIPPWQSKELTDTERDLMFTERHPTRTGSS